MQEKTNTTFCKRGFMNGQDINDYISLIGTEQKVEFSPKEGLWVEGTVKGINLLTNSILIARDEYSSTWQPLFFQLNIHHPKYYKVRIVLAKPTQKTFTLSTQRLKEIEDGIDDTAGLLIKSSSLKAIIEEEVNKDRACRRHEFMGGSCCIHCGTTDSDEPEVDDELPPEEPDPQTFEQKDDLPQSYKDEFFNREM
jgi:hypothetical protein